MLHYIHITHHTIILNQNRSFRNQQIIQEPTDIQTQHGLAQHLAQAEGSCSGKTVSPRRVPLRLGEGSKRTRKQRGISLRWDPSRLDELCARSKHTLVAWATTRAESSGRASTHLAWASQARLGESIRVRHCSHLHRAPNRGSKQSRHS